MATRTPNEPSLIHLQKDHVHGCSKVKVSSVLNRDIKQFGKKFMFDDDDETCWNTDQGTPQYVVIELPVAATVSSVHIRFQGGFASKECVLMTQYNTDSDWTELQDIYPEDSNSLQIFDISGKVKKPAKLYKLLFKTSTDFYGRLTVYHLQFYGQFHS